MVTAYARNQLFKVNNKEMMQEEYQERICFQIVNLYKAYTHREKNVGYFFLSVRIQLILTCIYFRTIAKLSCLVGHLVLQQLLIYRSPFFP